MSEVIYYTVAFTAYAAEERMQSTICREKIGRQSIDIFNDIFPVLFFDVFYMYD